MGTANRAANGARRQPTPFAKSEVRSTVKKRNPQNEPLLKWTGGKRWLAPDLAAALNDVDFGRYYEPFCGGAALFFRLAPRKATLSDTNAELINCYMQIKEAPRSVIAALEQYKNSEADYYKIRDLRPRTDASRAARIIYLTTLSFNGIYRVNLAGKFNVPYGYKTHLDPCNEQLLISASECLQRARLLVGDFEDVASEAKARDLLYFDPPYTVAHGNNGFIKYNEHILQWEDQLRLSCVATAAAERGCYVIVSNADHPSLRQLYSSFGHKRIRRASVIAASADNRRYVTESLFHNFL
jgi:DNA adenine methylase